MNVKVVHEEKYPQLAPISTGTGSVFVRGSVLRYIQIAPSDVDVELLQDAARKENAPAKQVSASS